MIIRIIALGYTPLIAESSLAPSPIVPSRKAVLIMLFTYPSAVIERDFDHPTHLPVVFSLLSEEISYRD